MLLAKEPPRAYLISRISKAATTLRKASINSASLGIIGHHSVSLPGQFRPEPQLGKTVLQPVWAVTREALAQAAEHELLQCAGRVENEREFPRRRRLSPQFNQHLLGFRTCIFGQRSHQMTVTL